MARIPNKEWAASVAPMLEATGPVPKLPIGDVEGRRIAVVQRFASYFKEIPPAYGIVRKTHFATATDGHQIAIYQCSPPASTEGKTSAVVHYHGGGMIMGSAPMSDAENSAYASQTGVQFFSVEYRLAPEYKHPVPVEDGYTALAWVHAHAEELGIDNTRIGVQGQSGGGGVAAGIALIARDRQLTPPLAKQILIYPMIDDRPPTPDPAILPHLSWDYDDNLTCWGAVLGSDQVGKDGVSSYAAAARAEDVSGMPSTYIDVGNLDIFWGHDMLYAHRLAMAGVDTEFHLYPGVPHAFELMAPDASISREARANRARALKSF